MCCNDMTAVNIDELCSSGVKIDRKQERKKKKKLSFTMNF